MTHDDLVFEAVHYRRQTGASAADIRSYLRLREATPHTQCDDGESLGRLAEAARVVKVGTSWFLTPAEYRQARGHSMPPSYQPEDAWILRALLGEPTDDPLLLPEIIRRVDILNRVVPSAAELYGAFNRLETVGLIRAKGGGFVATPAATELFAKVERLSRSLYDQMKALGRLLDCPCCGPPLKKMRWRVPLSDAEVEAAYATYRAQFERPARKRSKG